jgi:UDP-glucuronate decarboxylase
MKILVTGASGFVGSVVAKQLLDAGHEVIASYLEDDNLFRIKDFQERLDCRPADLNSMSVDQLKEYLGEGIDSCLHLAWYAVPGKYLASNINFDCVQGSLKLYQALGEAGCKRIASVGTCFEYDFQYKDFSEDTPTQADSVYASAKTATLHMGEQLCAKTGISFAWPRLFYLYGPNEDRRRLVPFVINSLMDGGEANTTSGSQVKDFMHVEDVASGLIACLMSELKGPMNIGSGIPVTVKEIVTIIAENLGKMDRVNFGSYPDSPTDPEFLVANNKKLKSTGWKPKYDLKSGLESVIEWWRGQKE